ncbi:MAG: branched-chain amino acid transport system ATP-binding protein [Frankiaceae bacterium]|nr:branched-chain amino acid transport system ATP-binding protein [Frankiaceae bacterium]MDQ1700182.1 branched-chain amino acid transport system ATP-binding protein [Frankiaceae bacterium]
MTAPETLLDVSSVDVYYGLVQALRGLSIQVGVGERVALLGANGAGKTTTLRTISGMLAPRAGTIRLGGSPIGGKPAFDVVREGVAHVPEGRALFAGMTVEENLALGFASQPNDRDVLTHRRDQVYEYFPILRERSKQAAGTLSGGEQQMLVIGRALMSAPRLLLVDELSLGLAPKIVAQIFEILETVNRDGTAVLIVEQFVHMALQNTDRAYVLRKGVVVDCKPSAELLGDPALIRSYLGEGTAA